MPTRSIFIIALILFLISSSISQPKIVVLTKSIEWDEPSSLMVQAIGPHVQFYIKGKVKNIGNKDAVNVLIMFMCEQSKDTTKDCIFTTNIDYLPAGETIDFRTTTVYREELPTLQKPFITFKNDSVKPERKRSKK